MLLLLLKGCKNVSMCTVEIDVVLAVALFRKIKPERMWSALGKGTSFSHTEVHEVTKKLDPSTFSLIA